MAYPEPIPALKGKQAKEFLTRLERFRLTSSQKRLYEGAEEFYLRHKPKEP